MPIPQSPEKQILLGQKALWPCHHHLPLPLGAGLPPRLVHRKIKLQVPHKEQILSPIPIKIQERRARMPTLLGQPRLLCPFLKPRALQVMEQPHLPPLGHD